MAEITEVQKPANTLCNISNELIECFVKKGNLVAFKILFYISSKKIDYSTQIYTTFGIDTKKMCEFCQMDIKTLKRNIKQLVETTISTTTDKSESYTNVISYAKLDYSGELHIEVRKNILELINETKNKFTIIDANKIMKLSSKHSVRMLMLLEYISNFSDDTGKRKSYTLDELNLMFGTNYTRLVEFERRVLKPIQAELASSSKLSFNYRVKYDKETATVGRARAVSVSIDVVTNAMLQLKLF